jgi:tetratricopeptide (TPR) repeat protein
MNKLVTALFLFCITFTASATDLGWFEVQSPHFLVLTDSSEKQARRLAAQFEAMRSVFHKLFPNLASDAGSPIIVLATKDRKGFQPLEPEAYLAKGQLDLAGVFLRTPDKNYMLMRLDAAGDHPYSTIYHEYTHYLLTKATWLPLWLNEGLAELYQNTDIHDKEVLLGQATQGEILYLRKTPLIPIQTLLLVDHSSPYYHEDQKGTIFYAEAWALTHYLEITDHEKKTNRVTDYAKLLIKGEDSVTAAQHAFGDLNKLQLALQTYIQQNAFSSFRMNSGFSTDASSFQVKSLSPSETDAYRADFLVHNQRTKDAEPLLAAVLRDDPSNALAHETMGFLMFQRHDIPAARKWYGEAVQLGSHSYLAHYYFATLTTQSGDKSQDAQVESSLLTSIKLNPSFAPSYDALAMFYGRRNEKLDEAYPLSIQAIQLQPDNLYYRLNAASVLSQQHNYASAINVLKAALPIAKSQVQEEMVQSRINQIQKYQASSEPVTK